MARAFDLAHAEGNERRAQGGGAGPQPGQGPRFARRREHQRAAAEAGDAPAGALARVHLLLGERDACFILLERDFEAGGQSVRWLKISPEWEPLRSDPRYHALLRRMHLE